MARLGFCFESHLLVVLCHDSAEEALGLFADALPPLGVGHPAGVVLLAVLAQPDLPHYALEQILHVVVQGGRGLDELAVKHHSTGPALCAETQTAR